MRSEEFSICWRRRYKEKPPAAQGSLRSARNIRSRRAQINRPCRRTWTCRRGGGSRSGRGNPIACTATTAAESPHQFGAPNNWRILSRIAEWSMPPRSCQVCKTLCQTPRVWGTTDAENSASWSPAEILPFQSSLRHWLDGSAESVGPRKSNPNIARLSVTGHVTTREHAGTAGQLQRPLPHYDDSGSNFTMPWKFWSWTRAPNSVPTFNTCVDPGVFYLRWLVWKRRGKILSSRDMEFYSREGLRQSVQSGSSGDWGRSRRTNCLYACRTQSTCGAR